MPEIPQFVKKNVVVLGGGSGASAVLEALKPYADQFNITGIVAMSDSGGSSGFLRQKYGVLPPGDLLRALLALSEHESEMLRSILYHTRFPESRHFAPSPAEAPNLGNLLLTFLQKEGGILHALDMLKTALKTVGNVVPITTEHAHLCAELSDGTITSTEHALDKPYFAPHLTIERLWLTPARAAHPDALTAIRSADYIIFGPGDLYTSIVATLLPEGVREALANSPARLIHVVANGRRIRGEPSPRSVQETVFELEYYTERHIDTVLYNFPFMTPALTQAYLERGWEVLDKHTSGLAPRHICPRDFELPEGGFGPALLSPVLYDILR